MSSQAPDDGSTTVLEFLKENVPKVNFANLETDLNKDFILAKRKSKQQKRKAKKNKTRALTRREKKELGFYEISRKSVNYSDMLPMNAIWSDYMSQVLETDKVIPDIASKSWEQFTQTIYKADFHGSIMKVVRSKCPSYVDKTGICIMDTRNTFKIVSKNNIVTTIPKKECVFEVYIRNIKITLFGKLFCTRPAERSTKKVKSQLFPDL